MWGQENLYKTNKSKIWSAFPAREYVNLWEACKGLPLFLDVFDIAKQHDRFELVIMKVWGTKGHDKITQSQGRRIGTNSGQTDDNVILKVLLRVGFDDHPFNEFNLE